MHELRDEIKPDLLLPQIGERRVHIAQRYLSDCWDGPLEAAKWVIDGVIPEGLTVISGQSGAGKTTALPGLAAAAAGFLHPRHPLQGPKNVRRRVVIVTEHPIQLVRLFAAAEARGDLLDGWRDYIRLVPGRKEKPEVWMEPLDMSGLITTCEVDGRVVNKGPLFIIDTMGYAFDLEDENSNDKIFALLAGLKEAWGEHVSTWLVTHTAKGRDNEEPRGASAKRDAADHTVVITEKGGKRLLKIKKTKYAHEETIFALKLYEQPMEVQNEFLQTQTEVIQISYAQPATQEDKASTAKASDKLKEECILELLADGPLPSTEINKTLTGHYDATKKLLEGLEKRGLVSVKKGRSHVWSLVEPTNEDF